MVKRESMELIGELVNVGKELLNQYDEVIKMHKVLNCKEIDEKNFDKLTYLIQKFDDGAVFLMFIMGDDFFLAHDNLQKEDVDILGNAIVKSSLIKYLMGEFDEETFRNITKSSEYIKEEDVAKAIKEFNSWNL